MNIPAFLGCRLPAATTVRTVRSVPPSTWHCELCLCSIFTTESMNWSNNSFRIFLSVLETKQSFHICWFPHFLSWYDDIFMSQAFNTGGRNNYTELHQQEVRCIWASPHSADMWNCTSSEGFIVHKIIHNTWFQNIYFSQRTKPYNRSEI